MVEGERKKLCFQTKYFNFIEECVFQMLCRNGLCRLTIIHLYVFPAPQPEETVSMVSHFHVNHVELSQMKIGCEIYK